MPELLAVLDAAFRQWRLLVQWTTDAVFFPALQVLLAGFALFAALVSVWHARRAGRGGLTLQVTRSPQSMALFYGTYAAITGLLVALCLNVEIAAKHRVLWAVLDTLLVGYVCLFNAWFRNKLVGWGNALLKLEKR